LLACDASLACRNEMTSSFGLGFTFEAAPARPVGQAAADELYRDLAAKVSSSATYT
jgi:hypothetical protein